MPESNPPVLTPNRNRAVQSKTFSTPTPVGVEKLHFRQNSRNLEDRKCLGKPRTSLIGHPEAILFLRISRVGVFQQPQALALIMQVRLRSPAAIWQKTGSAPACPPPTCPTLPHRADFRTRV